MQIPFPLSVFIFVVLGSCGVLLLAFACAALAERDLRQRGWDDYQIGGPRLTTPPIRRPPPPPSLAVPCSQPPAVPQPPSLPQPHLSPVEDEPSNENQLEKNTLGEDEPPNQMVCTICITNGKDLAFGCGHMSCRDCGSRLSNCHICRQRITTRVMLFTG